MFVSNALIAFYLLTCQTFEQELEEEVQSFSSQRNSPTHRIVF